MKFTAAQLKTFYTNAKKIVQIIEDVDHRAQFGDIVTPTHDEIGLVEADKLNKAVQKTARAAP